MVGRHQRQRLWSDQPDAAEFAAVEQRAAEGEIVGYRRAQSATAGKECRRLEIRALRRIVLQAQHRLALAGGVLDFAGWIGGVARGEAMRLVGGDVEVGVVHAEWFEDALLQELLE